MVRIQGPSDYERLDRLVLTLAEKHGLRLDATGWTRKTYDLYTPDARSAPHRLLARVESFATTSGEIHVYDDAALPFAEDLGGALEREFGVAEAVVVRKD